MLEEQTIRFMWEQHPFATSHSFVDKVLTATTTPDKSNMEQELSPLLQRLDSPTSTTTSSGYETLFRPLYELPNGGPDPFVPNDISKSPPLANERRHHFLIQVAYRGADFCGWQTQPHNLSQPSVQRTMEEWLERLENENGEIDNENENESQSVNLRVCGRTDAGVNAIGQVCRYRTLRKELSASDVYQHLQTSSASSSLGIRSTQVVQVTKSFHPTFGANCRAYVYLIDVVDGFWKEHNLDTETFVDLLNRNLQTLEELELDFIGLSYGRLKTKSSICTLHHARACLVQDASSGGRQAICIELVGNRFLRRMVRLLVATVLRIAVRIDASRSSNIEKDHLLLLRQIQEQDRNLIAGNAAPSDGLFFVGARFDSF